MPESPEENGSHPSPAPRERVPSAARRVRVKPDGIADADSLNLEDGQQQSSSPPPKRYRGRAAPVVDSARPATDAIQISPTISDWPLHRRFCLHRTPAGYRSRWGSPRRQWQGRIPSGSTRSARLDGDSILEQRCAFQHRWSCRSHNAGVASQITPHPPIAARRAPPSPASAGEGLSRRRADPRWARLSSGPSRLWSRRRCCC